MSHSYHNGNTFILNRKKKQDERITATKDKKIRKENNRRQIRQKVEITSFFLKPFTVHSTRKISAGTIPYNTLDRVVHYPQGHTLVHKF